MDAAHRQEECPVSDLPPSPRRGGEGWRNGDVLTAADSTFHVRTYISLPMYLGVDTWAGNSG
jgi:hypothetical protein